MICVAGKMHAALPIVTSVLLCVFQLLTNHYEQNWKFYCLPSGWGSYGTASEDELLLTKKIFWGVFDSLSQRVRLLSVESTHTHTHFGTLSGRLFEGIMAAHSWFTHTHNGENTKYPKDQCRQCCS